MNTRVPAKVFPPGEILREELEKRGWSQVELAEILARPPRLISELMAGKRAITPETAKGLEAAFGISAAFWMTLESQYQLSKTQFEGTLVARRATLYKKFPVKELIRRGWVNDSKDIGVLEANFCNFYRIDSIDESPAFEHAGKKTRYDDFPQALQLAWLNRAEQVASSVDVPPYTVAALKEALNELKTCLGAAEEVVKVSGILARAGVRLVIVEYLARAKVDGACFWLNKSRSPVIALSLRLDRIDNFWHTLLHEIDHILHGEGKQAPIVDLIEVGKAISATLPPEEQRANASAATYCVANNVLQKWISQTPRVSSRISIVNFASRVGVHPGIVVGQLQHLGIIPYSFHRDLLEKVRSKVVAATPTDGFGTN